MSATSTLEKEIFKREKKGFKVDSRRTLKYGLRVILIKKTGLFGTDEADYIYYVDGEATTDSMREFFKDYVKFCGNYESKGFFLSKGNIDEKLFKDLRRITVEDDNIRNTIRIMSAEKTVGIEKEQTRTAEKPKEENIKQASQLSKDVFIVHGKDHSAMKDLKMVLYDLHLNPKVLHDQAGGSSTIIEQLEKWSNVGFAFVILTPDDVGMEKSVFDKVIAKPEELKKICSYRARQNVILEFGYFIGKLSRNRVCCLYKGEIELPSDMHGIRYVQFKNSIDEIRTLIMKELKQAGYEIEI